MAIAFIASSANSALVAGTTGVSPGATIPVGSTVIFAFSNITSNPAPISDTQSNTYVKILDGTTSGNWVYICLSTAHQLTTSDKIKNAVAGTLGLGVTAYSGVVAQGTTASNSGTSTTPTISLTTQDANNFVVAFFEGTWSSSVTISANTGNLRTKNQGGGTGNNNALVDNTAASPSSVTDSVTTNLSRAWNAFAVELRVPATNHNLLMMTGCGT